MLLNLSICLLQKTNPVIQLNDLLPSALALLFAEQGRDALENSTPSQILIKLDSLIRNQRSLAAKKLIKTLGRARASPQKD